MRADGAQPPAPQVRIEPDARAWPALAKEHAERCGRAGRPVVMSGHQAEVWHPGILAKWFACAAAARAVSGEAVWLVVDQDEGEPTRLRFPARGEHGEAVPEEIDLRATREDGAGVPTGMRHAASIDADRAAGARAATPGVVAGLRRTAEAFARHADAPSLARQADAAVRDLIGGEESPRAIFATELFATDAFTEVLDAIRADPALCARTYNEAAAARPGAGVRSLERIGDRVELPLWRLAPGRPRRPVFSDEMSGIDSRALAPRGLLMTGLVRRRLCDLFIHGTGGGATGSPEGYDRVTEAWFASWLGETDLAPAVLATAPLRLPLGASERPTEARAAAARALAHRARHDPSIIGDGATARAKQAILDRVRTTKESGGDAAPHFAEMQSLLERYRAERADDLRRLDDEAERLARLASLPAAADDRTWPFVLHDADALDALRRDIEARFGASQAG
ncbi:MAG: hypothetical protein KIS87_11275 [Phycisphaeraceae bacterium]|nr:hypothetical protein [Phycisphaeraceae bacterium]